MKLGAAAKACKGKKGHPKPKRQFMACVERKMKSGRRK